MTRLIALARRYFSAVTHRETIKSNGTDVVSTVFVAVSVVGIATGYYLDDRGVGVRDPIALRIFSCPRRPDRLWSPPSLISNEHHGLFQGGKSAGA
jgi:hypothetical protein